jgi:monoamine oxidase
LATEGELPPGPRALSRRQALLLGGAAALAACAPTGVADMMAEPSSASDIAIVGGGVAGLTAAYRLAKAGKRATIYEASGRLGGRMFTKRNFNADGQFCELGGELVDSNHKPLMDLASELGIDIQRLRPETNPGEDIFAFGGRIHTEHELLREGRGAFKRMAQQIAKDKAALTDANDNWTERARELDAISIADYLKQFRGKAPPWVIELVDLAYWGEYGMPTDQQSALNLIDFMAPDPNGAFSMFGESDEAFRIAGGSQTLPDTLAERLGQETTIKKAHALEAIAVEEGRLALSFKTDRGIVRAAHDTVVLALPFTKLREVGGLDKLNLSAPKLKSIRELGYGDNTKIMVGTTSRPWTGAAARLPVKSTGAFYSDEFQLVWDTSRGQQGSRGILTNFLTATNDQAAALARMQSGLQHISPEIAESLDTSNIASFFWTRYPFAKGSYSTARVGQYTTLLEPAATPELGNRLHFAGEHTSADFPGFMCGGVQSGERVAAALLGATAAAARRIAA